MFRFSNDSMFFGVRLRAKTSRGAALSLSSRAPAVENLRLAFGGIGGDYVKITPGPLGFSICFNRVSNSSFKAKGSKPS